MYSAYLLWLVKVLNWKIQKQRFKLYARKRKKNLTIGLNKHGQICMKAAIKNLRFYFVKAMALKLIRPEERTSTNQTSNLIDTY